MAIIFSRLTSSVIAATALFSAATAFALEPNFGVATVDGDPSEWDTSVEGADFFAPLFIAGEPTKPWLANSYVRYDCHTKTLFVLVLDRDPTDEFYIEQTGENAWVRIAELGSDTQVDLNPPESNGTPPDSSWVPENGEQGPNGSPLLTGYEASFPIDEGVYDIEIHVNASSGEGSSDTLSTGKRNSSSGLLEITLQCPTEPNPQIDVEKSTNNHDADMPMGPEILEGEKVTWEYVITNTGNVTLTYIVLEDDQLGGDITAAACGEWNRVLEPGESHTCMMMGTAELGQYKNIATATGKYTDESGQHTMVDDEDPSHYKGVELTNPAIDVEKSTNGEDADDPTGPSIGEGALVTWEYVITNTGNVPLTQITLTDDKLGDISGASCSPELTASLVLQPGDSITCVMTGSATVGQYDNTASVSGKYLVEGEDPVMVNDTDMSHYFGEEGTPFSFPTIDIQKFTNGEDADTQAEGPELIEGQAVTWKYVILNTSAPGTQPLTNIQLTDSVLGIISADSCQPSLDGLVLAPGDSVTCEVSGLAGDSAYMNLGTVSGDYIGPDGSTDQANSEDPSHYNGIPAAPELDIEKFTNQQDADDPTGPNLLIGSDVEWSYMVTNTGNVLLSNIEVTDDQGVIVTCPQTTLAVNESMICTGSGEASSGQYANIGSVTGDYLDANGDVNDSASHSDPSHYFGADPSVLIEKSTQGFDADDPSGPHVQIGDTVYWLYSVKNTGNVDLTNITVTDPQLPAGTLPDCDGNGNNVIASLLVGETKTCSASGVATEGQYMNVGIADTDYTDDEGNSDDVTDDDPSHYFGVNPGIDIEKCTSPDTLTQCTEDSEFNHDNAPGEFFIEGDTVYWTVTATNTGNVALSNVLIDDNLVALDCGSFDGNLDIGESVTCTASATAVEGQYINKATASGDYTVVIDADGNTETRTTMDMDPSHYYAVVDNRPSLEVEVLSFDPVSDTQWEGSFLIENASGGPEVDAIAVTDIEFTIEYRLKGKWHEVAATCTTVPTAPFVFEGPGEDWEEYGHDGPGQIEVDYWCSAAEPIPDKAQAVRITVCVNIFNREKTFCSKLSYSR